MEGGCEGGVRKESEGGGVREGVMVWCEGRV